jgi:hypothetical protein
MKTIPLAGVVVTLCTASLLWAQELKMPPPEKEHEWLQQFVGEWESEMEASGAPGQPAMKCKGTIQSRAIGGFWVQSEIKSEMMGKPMVGLQTLGYDPKSKKYVGTWVDSMLSYLWKYEGTVDKTGKILTLEADGPNFMQEGKTARFRDIYEFKSKDHVVMSSAMRGEDGQWVTFMTGNSKRKK